MKNFWLLAVIGLSACREDETVSGYLDDHTRFTLQSLNGAPFIPEATIDLSKTGQVTGRAPCNTYSANQTALYPWFNLGPIAATKAACPALDQEQKFFSVLGRATLVEVAGKTLILSNTDGVELIFQADS